MLLRPRPDQYAILRFTNRQMFLSYPSVTRTCQFFPCHNCLITHRFLDDPSGAVLSAFNDLHFQTDGLGAFSLGNSKGPYTVRFFLIATAIPSIAKNGSHRTQLKCSYYATATTSPTPMQPIVSKNKLQSHITQCERALTIQLV